MKWLFILAIILLPHRTEAKDQGCSDIVEPKHFPLPWQSIHDQQLERLPSTVDVLLIGDSHAALWEAHLLSPRQIFNAGVGGALIEQVLWRVRDPKWQAVTPKNVVLFIGSNNHARGDCAVAIIDGISTLLSRVVRLWPDARVFVVGIPPRGPRGALRPSERVVINTFLKERVPLQGATYVGTDDLIHHLGVGDVHYNVEAYQALTSAIVSLLQ
jgi:hypothetical protein